MQRTWISLCVLAVSVMPGECLASANFVGPVFKINTYTTDNQRTPAIAGTPDGGFVVTWSSLGQLANSSIWGQRFDATGAAVGSEFQVSTAPQEYGFQSAIAAAPNGSFGILWRSTSGVGGQFFDSAGLPLGAQVSIAAGSSANPDIAAAPDGSFLFVWSDGNPTDVIARRYDETGVPVGAQFIVNTTPTANNPAIAIDGSGNFTVVWERLNHVFSRRFDASGVPLGGELQVDVASLFSTAADVAMASDGRSVVVWKDTAQGLPRGVRFDAMGAPTSSLSLDAFLSANAVQVAAGENGNHVVVRGTSGDVQDGRWFSASGGSTTSLNVSDGIVENPVVAATADANFVVAWSNQDDIYGRRLEVCGNDSLDGFEECDGTADGACPGDCLPSCQCKTCGDNDVNLPGEECDGLDSFACPNECSTDCLCAICGNDLAEPSPEQCDGIDDSACPGNCLPPSGNLLECRCAGPLDSFLCYRASTQREFSAGLSDGLDTGGIYSSTGGKRFCTPVSYDGQLISDDDAHLSVSKIAGPHEKRTNVAVQTAAGLFSFDTKRTDGLMMAASTAPLIQGAPPPISTAVDQYRCVKVKHTRDTPVLPQATMAALADRFGSREVEIGKPAALCVATAMDGNVPTRPDAHLLCYKIKAATKHTYDDLNMRDRIGLWSVDLKGETQLCVPATLP